MADPVNIAGYESAAVNMTLTSEQSVRFVEAMKEAERHTELIANHLEQAMKEFSKQSAQQFNEAMEAMSDTFISLRDSTSKLTNFSEDWITKLSEVNTTLVSQLNTVTGLGENYQKLKTYGEAYNTVQHVGMEQAKEDLEIQNKKLEAGESYYQQLLRRYEQHKREQMELHPDRYARRATVDATAGALADPIGSINKVMSNIPFGGIVSLMLMGIKGEAEFAAQTSRVVQTFDVVGGKAGQFYGEIDGMIKRFKGDLTLTAEEIKAVAGAFADAGIKAESVFGGSGVLQRSVALDKLMEVQTGTFATMIGSGVKEFGNNIDDVTTMIEGYAFAAQKAGQNTMDFLSGVIQTSSVLKLYNIQLESVATTTLQLISLNKAKGMGDQFAGTVAQAQMGGLAQGIAGIDQGMAIVIGSSVKHGMTDWVKSQSNIQDRGQLMHQLQGLSMMDLMVMMRTGGRELSGQGDTRDQFFTQTVRAMGKLVDMGDRGTSIYAARSLYPGLGDEGSIALVDIYKKIKSGETPTISSEDRAKLTGAMETEKDKFSAIQRAAETLVTAITQITNGLLGAILTTLKSIVQHIALGIAWFTDNDAKAAQIQKAIDKTNQSNDKFMKDLSNGISRLGDSFGHLGDLGVVQVLTDSWFGGGGGGTGRAPRVSPITAGVLPSRSEINAIAALPTPSGEDVKKMVDKAIAGAIPSTTQTPTTPLMAPQTGGQQVMSTLPQQITTGPDTNGKILPILININLDDLKSPQW
jgi:hypothetical protein